MYSYVCHRASAVAGAGLCHRVSARRARPAAARRARHDVARRVHLVWEHHWNNVYISVRNIQQRGCVRNIN